MPHTRYALLFGVRGADSCWDGILSWGGVSCGAAGDLAHPGQQEDQ